jgi:hypothetical protein
MGRSVQDHPKGTSGQGDQGGTTKTETQRKTTQSTLLAIQKQE